MQIICYDLFLLTQQINWKKFFLFSIKYKLLSVHRQEILQKAKNNYCKENAAKYYLTEEEKR